MYEMPSNLVEEMPSLTEIIANLCSLRKISLATFGPHNTKNLMNMEILNFENNKITTVEPAALAGATNLRNLNLRFNHISELEDSAFHGLQKLEELYLDGNRLKMLPEKVFFDLTSVENIYLTGNRLVNINLSLFKSTLNLAILSLSDNLLTSMDFEEVASLKHLLIDGNNFVELQVKEIKSDLPKLQSIGIYKNNWNCQSLMQLLYQLKMFNIDVWFPTDKHTKIYDQLNAFGIVCYTSDACKYF
jgi:Leucine-rich repeat (LRR) protein